MLKKLEFDPAAKVSALSVTTSDGGSRAILPYDPSKLPTAVNRTTDIEIPRRVWSNWTPTAGPREIVRPLTGEEHAALSARAAELDPALKPYARPAQDDEVALALADMLGGFRSMRQQNEDVLGIVEVTMRVLAEFPAWAIKQACRSIQANGYLREHDGRTFIEKQWAPTDAQIADAVRETMKPYCKALVSAQALLSAPVEPPPPPRLVQHDWHVLAFRRHNNPPPDMKHGARVAANLAARKAARASEVEQ